MKENLVTQQSIDTHSMEHISRRHDYPNENIVRLVGSFFQGQTFGKVEVDRSIDKNGKVLDYGCADGNNSKFLLDRGFSISAIDITEESIKKTKNNLNNYDPKRWDAKVLTENNDKLPYDDNNFDYIISNQVVYFLASRNRINLLLKEFQRVLKPNGRMIISMLSRFNTYCFEGVPKGDNVFTYKTPSGEIDVYVTYDETHLRDIFSLFNIVEIGYWDNYYNNISGHHFVVKAVNIK